jgi:hypothetical protein
VGVVVGKPARGDAVEGDGDHVVEGVVEGRRDRGVLVAEVQVGQRRVVGVRRCSSVFSVASSPAARIAGNGWSASAGKAFAMRMSPPAPR